MVLPCSSHGSSAVRVDRDISRRRVASAGFNSFNASVWVYAKYVTLCSAMFGGLSMGCDLQCYNCWFARHGSPAAAVAFWSLCAFCTVVATGTRFVGMPFVALFTQLP